MLDLETKKPLANSSVYLVTQDNTDDTVNIYYFTFIKYKILFQTKTDSTGYYSFNNLVPKSCSIIADFIMPEIKNLGFHGLRQDIDSSTDIATQINYYKVFYLMVTCPYDKTKDWAFCPKCRKKDKVVPIIYGLPIFNEDGKIGGLKPGEYALGGCVMDSYCNPSKTCLRCKSPF